MPIIYLLRLVKGLFGGSISPWPGTCATHLTVVSRKRAHYGLSAHPKFCLDFLLRSRTYSKEHPPSASIASRDFLLSVKPEHVVRLVYIHYKVQIMLLHGGLH